MRSGLLNELALKAVSFTSGFSPVAQQRKTGSNGFPETVETVSQKM
jgi:hypothetical protein